jgi:asparagine synthase (glutamine-hydrolysing)
MLSSMLSSSTASTLLEADFRKAVAGHDPARPYHDYYHALNGEPASDHLNRLMYVDLKTMLVDGYMEKTDKATMACGLEARVPLLDRRLVELAFQVPGRLKIRGGSSKRILKQAVRDLLLVSVLRKPKQGFAVPLDPWSAAS